MKPRIEEITAKKLIGMRIKTSLAENKTAHLWQKFMSRKDEINSQKNSGYFSVQIFPEDLSFKDFDDKVIFEKWAAVEVKDVDKIPEDMETHALSAGKYAVFIHHGPVSAFGETLNYIFGIWLPNSDYLLDNREHFEIMGEKYFGPTHPDSEEEVWIPIKDKLPE